MANAGGDTIFLHDRIACHANVMDKEGAPLAVDVQPPGVSAGLDHLWIMAQHDHERGGHATIAAIPHRLRLGLGASAAKPRYNRSAGALVRRKTGMSRYHDNFAGGASVFGFVEHGAWAFYFQTWGAFTGNRPWYAGLYHLAWRKTDVKYKVLECLALPPLLNATLWRPATATDPPSRRGRCGRPPRAALRRRHSSR